MTPSPSELAGRTMVIVSTQDWDDLQTRKQRFARRFAHEGCRVLYVEAQWHWFTFLRNRPRARERLHRGGKLPRQVETNLWLWTPPPQMPFFQIWAPLARWNNRRLAPRLAAALKAIDGDAEPLLYLYTPYNSILIDTLKPHATLYECVDDYAAAKGLIRARTVQRLESDTLQRADACVVTARALYAQRQTGADNLHLIPNAADVDHFRRALTAKQAGTEILAGIPQPRLGFVGAIHYWIDMKLLAHVARARPDWQMVLVGPVYTDTAPLRGLNNVHFTGRQPYERLPELIAGFDVCLIPYLLDDVARGCDPLKLYEYLATGKPVVSVAMPEVERFAPPVQVGVSYDDFVARCASALEESASTREQRAQTQLALMSGETWDDRYARTKAVWESLLT